MHATPSLYRSYLQSDAWPVPQSGPDQTASEGREDGVAFETFPGDREMS